MRRSFRVRPLNLSTSASYSVLWLKWNTEGTDRSGCLRMWTLEEVSAFIGCIQHFPRPILLSKENRTRKIMIQRIFTDEKFR